jgi:ribonucleases P/MRP protein subunit RPP40
VDCRVLLTTEAPSPDPLEQYQPTRLSSSPSIAEHLAVKAVVPCISPDILLGGDRERLEIEASELYEWLSLIRLQSPRVTPADNIDSFLARYHTPQQAQEVAEVCKISWRGFIGPHWLRLLVASLLSAVSQESWFTVSASEFPGSISGSCNELTLLKAAQKTNEYLLWRIESPE